MQTISIKLFAALLFIVLFAACWQRRYDYVYETLTLNATNDTLTFCWGVTTIDTGSIAAKRCQIFPKDTAQSWETRFGAVKIDCGIDPVSDFFRGWGNPIDTVLIYRHDSLVTLWKYPNYYGSPDDHNFFNYNAWKTWLINSQEGKIMFTILPEDLKQYRKGK